MDIPKLYEPCFDPTPVDFVIAIGTKPLRLSRENFMHRNMNSPPICRATVKCDGCDECLGTERLDRPAPGSARQTSSGRR